jgi:hypothetical protein
MSEKRFREIFFDPKILTWVSNAGIGGGIVVAVFVKVFGLSQ